MPETLYIVNRGNNNPYVINLFIDDIIISSIKKMYSFTEKQRKDMGIRNREKVMKNNSIEMFTDKYVRIINNLAK